MARAALALIMLCGAGLPAVAADSPPPSLPTLALSPQPAPSIWTGLHVGSDVFVVARKGSKAALGADADIGYTRAFANNIVLGIDATAGYAPYTLGHGSFKGYDFGEVDAKVGYDMGRLMPYLTTGVVLARPTWHAGSFNAGDSINDLFNGSDFKAAASVGAGFDYALTNNLTVGLGVSVGTLPSP